eukprot:gnl/TRDRNA2_/TRDRNA2_185200_c0_seq1.p1 gnl/TRDRNA2_/TRDRNA2_185200_c0~~gnl/TRDRNA2_/TRDRNA2_185200_c0_seq1.p1  ORF type:complete len:155 (-),score=41.97 gnl/TRDRNA2_/TRDRNA2_185200_c0_seq1:98-562(-)
MAGHAEKKQAKKADAHSQYYLWAILAINALYVVWRVLLHWDSMGKWNIVGWLLFMGVSYLTNAGIKNALELGVDYEYYLDVYLVNLTTQFFVTFSNWGWLLYLTVPGFIGWKILKMFLDWVFTPQGDEIMDEATKKRLAKKERQAERPKFKTIR